MNPEFSLPGPDNRAPRLSRRPRLFTAWPLATLLASAALIPLADAQVAFSPSKLGGLEVGSNNKASKVTSLQFGPDNRLYFTQVNGTIIACEVTRVASNNYQAANAETISLVKNIPNYDDDGTRNFTLNTRQTTGILVVGTAANPVIYVSSSDPREGAGSGANDLNLDTNSGIISRLTKNGSGVWEKVDIVRGLPRSEENHASNGVQIDPTGTKLLLAQGGNTNAGAPSNNFAFASETALSAAVLSIDLVAIEAMPIKTDAYGQHYIYDIPTVNDPNPGRAHNPDGSDANDPFGGNDGLNQARIVAGGPVQVYASGFRNPYDVLIAKTPGRAGKMYTFDNAANSGWGGYPKNEGAVAVGQPSTVTNEYVVGEAGAVNNLDNLHLITGPGYYGGHPNPIRANPAGAGWFHVDGTTKIYSATPTTDWPPVPLAMADPQEGDFRMPGAANGALWTNSASTTGMAEYTASNFGGAMVGNIIAAQYSSGVVQRLVMNADGTQVLSSSTILSGSAYGTPLDIAIPGPDAAPALAGMIFVGHHSSKITVLEPTDFTGICNGTFSFALDEDKDGYSNADEINNGKNPCSPGDIPDDRDGDFLSDLLDTDDDNDGIADTLDVFAIDALDGADVSVPHSYSLLTTNNESQLKPTPAPKGFFGIGFTGLMLNPGQDYLQNIVNTPVRIIGGGTGGLFTDPNVGPGNPHGANNNQVNAFHFGINVEEFAGPFRIRCGLGGQIFNDLPTGAQSQGIFIGNGDQDNYLKLAVNAASGAGGIEIVHEEGGVILSQSVTLQSGLLAGDIITLTFLVDPVAGTVQPGYFLASGSIIDVGGPISVGGKILETLKGTHSMSLGLLATTGGAPTFNATWDYFDAFPVTSTAAARLTINSASGSIATSSTNSGGSIQVENLSTSGQKIVSIKLDLSTAMLPDVVFDPAGTAGDTDGKGFDLDSFNGIGLPIGTFESPHDGVGSEDGYNALKIDFPSGTEFRPGDLLTFSADVDPTSVKGAPGPGPSHAASVSGLELIGSTVTVTFDDGTVRKMRNAGITSVANSNKTSISLLSSDILPTPKIYVPGKISPFVTTTQPTVRVAGAPGSNVKIWVFNASLFVDGVANGGYDIDPFEANSVTAYGIVDSAIGATGFVDVPIALTNTTGQGGINYVAAVLVDANGKRSASSNILTIDYEPSGSSSTALLRVNAGGPSYVDSSNQTWAADSNFTSGSTSSFPNPIEGTVDDTLYQTFRFNGTSSSPLDYSFPVPNGQYQVKLHFAETWSGITAAGQRIFDVLVENTVAVDNLDVFAEAGANTALVKTVTATVGDGQLTIGLRHGVQNPFICAIEVFSLGGGTGSDTEPPSIPGYFAATNVAAGSLNLLWANAYDNVGIAGYRVYRDEVLIGTTTLLNFPDPGRTPSTLYHYSVEAFDVAGNVSERSSLTVTTPEDTQNPTSPGNFKAYAGNASASLTWTAATDDAAVTGYRVYRDGNLLATVTTLSFSETGLINGTIYAYQVIAIDGTGKTSPPVSGLVRPRAIADNIFRINVGGPAVTDPQDNVWAADYGHNGAGILDTNNLQIAGTVDDIIYRDRRYDPSSGAELKYTFPGIPNGDYELRLHFAETTSAFQTPAGQRVFDVKVQNQLALDNLDIVGTVGYATALVTPIPVSVTNGVITVEFIHIVGFNNPVLAGMELYALEAPPADTQPPTTPGSLAVSGTTPGSVSLTWTASIDNVDVTGYRVSRNGGTPVTVTTLSFTDTGLLAATEYNYSVAAVDAAGNASIPATVTGTTPADTTAPSAPGSLAAEAGNATATLTWTASTDDAHVAGYRVYLDDVLLETVTELSFGLTGLTNDTAYHFKVTAIDPSDNESAPSLVTVTPRVLGLAVHRIDCGKTDPGYSYTDPLGNVWARDEYFNTNNTNVTTVTNTITGTNIPEIYKSFHSKQRTNSTLLKYEIPVANGNYEVRLHFAETSTAATVAVGYRVFNVLLEGSTALANLDVYSQVGKNKALVKALPATITDGKITLDFINGNPVAQNPFVCGIEIFPILSGAAAETVPPSTPGSFQASNLTENSVSLGWTASTDNIGVAGYRIYRDAVLINTVTTLSANLTGLAPGTLYHYSVVAFDVAGNVSPAALLDVTTLTPDTQAPSTPGNLAATPGLRQVVLAWDASTDSVGVTGYQVLRDGNLITTVTTPGYTDTGLTSGVLYAYQVIAVDAALNLSDAATANVTTTVDTQAPTIPGGLAATPAYTTVALSWAASTDDDAVTGYRVYRDTVLLATVTTLNYEDTGLLPGTSHNYEVRAIDAALNASDAATATAATTADTQAPTVPVGLEATPGNGSITLGWAPSSDNVAVTGYQVRRDGALLATVPVPGYSDPSLVNGTLYLYEVKAIDATGNLSAAATDSATPRVISSTIVRLNAGGLGFQDTAGNTWVEDTGYYSFGSSSSTLNPIAGTEDDVLYQSERYDSTAGGSDLEYSIAGLQDGQYEVRLHFAETFAGITAPGMRVFDVMAENALAIDNMDIFARVGLNRACIVTFPVTVTDGNLDIRFLRGVQNPKVCGIEVFAIQTSGQPPAQTFSEWLTANGIGGQTTGDADHGGLDNFSEFELQMNPNSSADDLEFSLRVAQQAGTATITLPVLKPIGNYYVHRDSDLTDVDNVANRIATITKAQIQAMSPAQRANHTVEDTGGGTKAFYQVFFVPVAE